MSTVPLLVETLKAADAARPRSMQKGIGPSALGGCRRQVAMQLLHMDEPNKEQVDSWAALKGSIFHNGIESAFLAHLDPHVYRTEITLPGHPDLRLEDGHADLYRGDIFRIVDWKSTLKKSLRYFPGTHRKWQVMTYGWMAKKLGLRVDDVEIVAIPLDGGAEDVQSWVFPYDEAEVERAFDWLREVLDTVTAVEETGELDFLPAPERQAHNFCRKYCEFFSDKPDVGCAGLSR